MTFQENIVYLRLRSAFYGLSVARDANDSTRVQINNIPFKSHFIVIIINKKDQILNSWFKA